jgi:hypothetical protein
MILVPLFDLKVLTEFAATAVELQIGGIAADRERNITEDGRCTVFRPPPFIA